MFDVGDPWQSYKNLDKLTNKQRDVILRLERDNAKKARRIKNLNAVIKHVKRLYAQGRDEEAKDLMVGISKL